MVDCIHVEEVQSKNLNEDDEEVFWEAFEEFTFSDCSKEFYKSVESDIEMSSCSIVTLDSEFNPEKSSAENLRRRRYSSSGDDSMDSTRLSSLVSFEGKYVVYKGENFDLFPEMKGSEEESEHLSRVSKNPDSSKFNLSSESAKEIENEEKEVHSATSYANNARVLDFLLDDILSVRQTNDAKLSFLTVLAGLVMRAIEYQFNLWIRFFRLPIWLSSVSFMFVMDPFSAMKQGREYLIDNAMRTWILMFGNLSIYEWFREPRSVVELVLKFVWGLLWSVYVGVVLTAMLVSAFVMGGILMRVVVEEPIRMEEKLDFDYTGRSPVEFVPIIACPEACYGTDCSQKLEVAKLGGSRVIPPQHKLQVTVSLTLPESDYNRNLGIFQQMRFMKLKKDHTKVEIRVDFLAADGKVLASSRHPCMLQFRSQPIRLLLTFLKVPPILYGWASETQDLKIKFKGFTEAAATPTACLRVTIEQRAEFQAGAGIPEVHSASLILESEQPGLKRVVWYWKKTLFVWSSMTIFTTELLFVLLCCNPILMPRVKLGGNSARTGASGNAVALSYI